MEAFNLLQVSSVRLPGLTSIKVITQVRRLPIDWLALLMRAAISLSIDPPEDDDTPHELKLVNDLQLGAVNADGRRSGCGSRR